MAVKMYGIIYKIENRVNSKVYIGQTKNSLKERWRKHCMPSEKCTCLVRAIQKYGKENFSKTIIELCSPTNIDEREKYWIKKYNAVEDKNFYNN